MPPSMAVDRTERVGIAGSGAIACGVARLVGNEQRPVLWARSDRSAERVQTALAGKAAIVTDLEALADRTIVIEAVAEDMEVKTSLLGRLGAVLPAGGLLASTTSSLSVAELADASKRPDRFGALHFFNPVERMELVELAFPPTAAQETRERFAALCAGLGRTAVEVPNTPGFVVNRLLFPYLFDAVRFMRESGLTPEAVDTCMKLGAAHPMGPLALLDFVGLDVAVAIGESLAVDVPAAVIELVEAGRLGRKSGAGFHDYS